MSKTEEIFRDNSFVGEIWSSVTWTTYKNIAGKQVCYFLSAPNYSERVYRNLGEKSKMIKQVKKPSSFPWHSTALLMFPIRIKRAKFYTMLWSMKIKWRLWNHFSISLKQKVKVPRIFKRWFWKNQRNTEMIFKIVEGKHIMILQWWLVCILVFRNVSRKVIKKHNLLLVQITRRIWRVFMRLLFFVNSVFWMCGTFVWIFSSSTHHWEVLTSVTGQGVKRITEIRWSARGEAVSVVKKTFLKNIKCPRKVSWWRRKYSY